MQRRYASLCGAIWNAVDAERQPPLAAGHLYRQRHQLRIIMGGKTIRALRGVLEADPSIVAAGERRLEHRPRRQALAMMHLREQDPRVDQQLINGLCDRHGARRILVLWLDQNT